MFGIGRILGVRSPMPLGLCHRALLWPCSTACCPWRNKLVSSLFQGVHSKTVFSTCDFHACCGNSEVWLLSSAPALLFSMTFKGEAVRLFHCRKACSRGVRLDMPQDGQPLRWPRFLHLPDSFIHITQQQGQSVAGPQNLAVLITTTFHSTLLKQGHADNGYFISVLCVYWAIYFPTYVSELERTIHF